jgi:hypothetical protein
MESNMSLHRFACVVLGVAVALGSAASLADELPPGLNVVSLAAHPQAIELGHKFDYRQLLIMGVLDTGERVDMTRTAKLAQPGQFVTVDDHGLVRSFVQDVQPALSKMGCNAGTCHGSKDGKNGFKLSLRGYDPLFDTAR